MITSGSTMLPPTSAQTEARLRALIAALELRIAALEALDALPPPGDDDDVLTLVSGEPAWVAPAAGAGWTVIVKPSNEIRNTTTTLANDTHLKFTMAANTVYAIRVHLFYTLENTGGNFKFGISGPSGATLVQTQRWDMPAGSSSDNAAAVESGYAWNRISSTGAPSSGGKIRMYIIVQNGANAGTFAVQWAQGTSDADDTIVYAGSTLEWVEA